MFSKTWKTSERKYEITVERDVKIKITDGTEIDGDIFRPNSNEKFPAIFGFSPYRKVPQSASIRPGAFSISPGKLGERDKSAAYVEAGDPNFFVRRGYAHIIANVRGSGNSGGQYPFFGPRELQDGVEVINWIASQPWCDGNVGMFGISYFAMIQLYIAALNPPHLKCLFAPWAQTDIYRDGVYHGGILSHSFWRAWITASLHNCRPESYSKKLWTEKEFQEAIVNVLKDQDIADVPELINILKNPDVGSNPIMVDFLLNPHDGAYWEERKVKYETIEVPTYLGACWGVYGLHLPGAFRSWENLRVPKKMIIGPPAYLERPLYQIQYEALRWFDFWLKGINTGIMDEPPIRLFVMGTNAWKEANEWPLSETKWTPFYLHENGLLWEHELWPNEGYDSFDDSPWHRGYLEYCSPSLVEDTEIIGPISLNLYASTTDSELLWFISLREVDKDGSEKILTRGWLKGTHREIIKERTKDWEPYHPHTESEALVPGEIYEFNIALVPTGNLFKAGSKIKVRISCTDDEPKHAFEVIASGHIRRQSPSLITVYHEADHPSHILLPITKGNVIGTFISGGKPYL